MLTFVLIGAAQALYGPALPGFARAYGIDVARAGIVLSAHSAGGLVALLYALGRGGVTGRHALALLAAGSGLIAAGLGWGPTLAGAAVLGAGYALATVVFNRRFLIETGPRGPAMVGALNAVFGIGAIAGPLVLVAVGGSTMLAFGLVALVALAILPTAASPAIAGAAQVSAAGARPGLLTRPGLLLLGALGVGFEVAFVGLGPAALIDRGMGEAEAAVHASAFFAAFLVSRLSLVWLATRVAALHLVAGAFALNGAAALAATFLAPGAFFVLAGAATGVVFPSFYVAASAALGTEERSTALIMIGVYVGAIGVPAILALVLGQTGAAALFPILAVYAFGTALAALLQARRG